MSETVNHATTGEDSSPDTKDLDAALARAQKAFPAIERTKTVSVKTEKGNYSFDYAPLDEIIDAVRPALADNGLAVKALVSTSAEFVCVTTKLAHASGQWEKSTCRWPRPARIQDFGGIVTYLRRYTLCGILNIAAETDDDGNADDGNERAVKSQLAKPKQEPKPALPEHTKDLTKWDDTIEILRTAPLSGTELSGRFNAELPDLAQMPKPVIKVVWPRLRQLAEGRGLVWDATAKVFFAQEAA